jgi:plasmid maintenance system killer protein
MKVNFKNQELLDWYMGDTKGKPKFQESVLKQYRKQIDRMQEAPSLQTLMQVKSAGIHPLKKELAGKYAAKVNVQYRIVFSVFDDELLIENILIEDLTDYH